MVEFDFVMFLVSGIVGVAWDQKIAWGILGVWALLRLLKVF